MRRSVCFSCFFLPKARYPRRFEDAAVAGASSLTFPNLGYLYAEGLVSSVDGYVPSTEPI